MRDFFKTELKTLHIKTGLQQYFKLSADPAQLVLLLDELVRMCNYFPLIPEEKKKEIILSNVITDADFQGFNPKILWKWFNAENRKYLPKDQSAFSEEVAKPTLNTPEEQAAIDALLADWKKQLQGAALPDYKTLAADVEKIKAEDKERNEQKKAIPYTADVDKAMRATLHNHYLLENWDTKTGKKRDCWMEFEEWLELKFPSQGSEQSPTP